MLMEHKSLIHNQPSLKTIFSKPPMGFIFNEIKLDQSFFQLLGIFELKSQLNVGLLRSRVS